jgi:hypothetical protein
VFDPAVWAAARAAGLAQLRERLRAAAAAELAAPSCGALWCQHEGCVLTEVSHGR